MVELLMAEWRMPLREIVDGLSLPQIRLLSKALGRRRLRETLDERRWQLMVAALPLQEKPGTTYQEMMDMLSEDVEMSVSGSREWRPSPSLPLLHEITESQAAAMRMPIHFVKVEDDNGA